MIKMVAMMMIGNVVMTKTDRQVLEARTILLSNIFFNKLFVTWTVNIRLKIFIPLKLFQFLCISVCERVSRCSKDSHCF